MAPPSSSVSKMIAKLETNIRDGSFYDTQQVYKSVSARYMAQGKTEDALELLQSGACLQLEHHQINCGVELGKLMVEALGKASTPYSTEVLERLLTVYRAFVSSGGVSSSTQQGEGASAGDSRDSGGADVAASVADAASGAGVSTSGAGVSPSGAGVSPSPQAVQGALEFLKAATRWSMKAEGGSPMGAPALHDCMAQCYWQYAEHKDTYMASQHFALGTSTDAFAAALLEVMEECHPEELDLVVARAVFQYLSAGKLEGAKAILHSLQSPSSDLLPSRSGDAPGVPDTPLMHFLNFLLISLEREAYPLFKMLRVQYSPSLERDPSFINYLDEVAAKFYGIRRQQGGFLGDIMQMLMSPDS